MSAKKKENKEKTAMLKILGGMKPVPSKVVVKYDGFGDEGDISEILVFFGKEQKELINAVGRDAVMEYVYTLLPDGWEDNEGGFGLIEINVKTGKVAARHNTRYIESTMMTIRD